MSKTRVIAIGIDGGEFSVFESMIKKGRMPNLESIMKRGFARAIDTSVTDHGQGWASFITGKSPEKNGVFYWNLYKKLINSSFIKDQYIWEILGEKGFKSSVMNMSYTHPPRPFNGYLISGLGSGLNASDNLKLTYPDSLMEDIESNVGTYMAGLDYKDGNMDSHIKLVRDIITMTQKRTKTCLYIMDKYSPDFVLVVFRGADLIQHCYWNFLEAGSDVLEKAGPLKACIEDYYEELDRSIGGLLEKYDGSINIILSDHGFGPVKAMVYLNRYLEECKFLTGQAVSIEQKDEDVRSLRALLKGFYLGRLKKYGFFRKLNRFRKSFQGVDLPIDMAKTVAYCDAFGGVNINRKALTVPIDEAKRDLLKCLRELRDPVSGELVMDRVYLREDSYAKKIENAPDILFEAKESFLVNFQMPPGDVRVFRYMDKEETSFFTGSHRRAGMLVVDGAEVPASEKMRDLRITDVSATILDLFGVDIPADFDGRAIQMRIASQNGPVF